MTVEITVTPAMAAALREELPWDAVASWPVTVDGAARVRLTLTGEAAARAALHLCDVADDIRAALVRARR